VAGNPSLSSNTHDPAAAFWARVCCEPMSSKDAGVNIRERMIERRDGERKLATFLSQFSPSSILNGAGRAQPRGFADALSASTVASARLKRLPRCATPTAP